MYGTDETRNAIYGSESAEAAERDIDFFFEGQTLEVPQVESKGPEWTFALIKPDAVNKGKAQVRLSLLIPAMAISSGGIIMIGIVCDLLQEIKQLIQMNGFTIIMQQKIQVCFWNLLWVLQKFSKHGNKDSQITQLSPS
jgi:hypothetical protein